MDGDGVWARNKCETRVHVRVRVFVYMCVCITEDNVGEWETPLKNLGQMKIDGRKRRNGIETHKIKWNFTLKRERNGFNWKSSI